MTSIAQPERAGQTNILVSTSVFSSFRDDLSVFLVSESKASIWESLQRANHFYRSMLQVHSEALRHPDIQSIIFCPDNRKCGFDLGKLRKKKWQPWQSLKLFVEQINPFLINFPSVITSPLFNEMGVLLGNDLTVFNGIKQLKRNHWLTRTQSSFCVFEVVLVMSDLVI